MTSAVTAAASDNADRREHFRVIYPVMVQPRFEILGERHAARILDCSESGVRYKPATGVRPEVGSEVAGTLRFHPRRQAAVRGTVVRVGRNDVALVLVPPGIPLTTVFAEQRHLMRLYPDGYQHAAK